MKLVHEFTLTVVLKPPVQIAPGPVGTRVYYELTGGKMTGERLRGRLLGGTCRGEWAAAMPDGFIRIDVRLQGETHDGANLYFQYGGLLEVNEAVQNALTSGGGTEYGQQYLFTNPRLETGDERYAWINRTFFVGEGRVVPGHAVEYLVWRPA